MAGNKALQKFKESKIPKKGKAKTIIEIPIYSEPNTHSSIIGLIKKNQEITWISKSICDDREWIRCNQDNNYGYIVGYENDGKCNLEIGTIKEIKEETKKEYGFEQKVEVIPITKEEIKLGDEALEEILNDDDDKKNDYDNDSKTNISTENDESQKSDLSRLDDDKNKPLEINIDNDEWDNSFEDDINKINEINNENSKLINEIKCQIEKDKNKKKGNDIGNSVSEVICSLKKDLPEDEQTKIDKMIQELYDIHEASQQKEAQKRKAQKENKEFFDDDKVEVNGKRKPMDHSDNIGDFNSALKSFKKKYNIPKNQNPDFWTDNYDRNEKYQVGEVYIFKIRKNGKDVLVECRNDKLGHKFENDYSIPGHLNGPKKEHYFHTGQGKLHNIPYITKEKYDELKKKYDKYE